MGDCVATLSDDFIVHGGFYEIFYMFFFDIVFL